MRVRVTLVILVAVGSVAGAVLYYEHRHRDYLDAATEHRANEALAVFERTCDASRPRTRTAALDAAVNRYRRIATDQPNQWLRSGLAVSAETQTKETAKEWASEFSGPCRERATPYSRRVADPVQ